MGPSRATGWVPAWQPSTGHHASKLVLTCHDPLPVFQPAMGGHWRFMARYFSVSGFAVAADATRCSGSVSTVIVDSAMVAPPAVPKHDSSSRPAPTAATNAARKAGSTIQIPIVSLLGRGPGSVKFLPGIPSQDAGAGEGLGSWFSSTVANRPADRGGTGVVPRRHAFFGATPPLGRRTQEGSAPLF